MGVSDHFSFQEYHKALDKALEVAVELKVKHWYFERKKPILPHNDYKKATEDWCLHSQMSLGNDNWVSNTISENFFRQYHIKKSTYALIANSKVNNTKYLKPLIKPFNG